MKPLKLFMLLLGCKPKGRFTEQHDILFSIGTSIKEIVPHIMEFWPDGGKIHIDAWREVSAVEGYKITVSSKKDIAKPRKQSEKLFFLNLGGYKPGEFEEYHYKLLIVSKEKAEAIQLAKRSAFYKHTGFKGAASHIDDKYGIDVDDIYDINDILPQHVKEKYTLNITSETNILQDEWHLGYMPIGKLKE